MALPIVLNSAKYEVELPISKTTVEYRPYLVKEEKILMMAMESGDPKGILIAVQDIIEACTNGAVKAKTLPTTELEFLFLKLRAKSVGERVTIGYECSSCETQNDIEINLDEVEISGGEDIQKTTKIMLTDKVGMTMRYPTANDMNRVVASKGSELENTFVLIQACIDSIFDENGIYHAKDLEKDDINKFVDSLSSVQFGKIRSFFEKMPKLRKDISFTCTKCGTKNDLVLEGLQSFFA